MYELPGGIVLESIVGQEQVKSTIQRMLTSGCISHTLLFAGPNGVGKSEAAFELARALLCREDNAPCGTCGSCLRASKLEHPDLHLLFPFRAQPQGADAASAWVDSLQVHRKLLASELYAPAVYEKGRQIVSGLVDEVYDRLHETSFEGGRRLCVILGAEHLNVKTANSLLKILEEPPPGVHFILTAERLSSVLPTITSRSAIVRFKRLKTEEIDRYLSSSGLSDDAWRKTVAKQAEGSLKAAKILAFGEKTDLTAQAIALYAGVAHGGADDVIKGAYSFQWSREVSEAEEVINSFVRLTGDVLMVKYGMAGRLVTDSKALGRLAVKTDVRALNRLSKKFEECFDMLGRNVSISMVMTTLMYEIHDAYR